MSRSDITPQLLKKLYHGQKLPKREVALRLKCNITTIHKKMARFGISTRDRIKAVRIAMQKKIIILPKYKLQYLYLHKSSPISEIAKILVRDRATIRRELVRYGIPLRSKAHALKLSGAKRKIKKSLLQRLYFGKRLTQQQIAQKIGRSRGTITRLMRAYGLKTRPAAYYHTRYPKYDFSGNLQEKAYLIGFRLGDLHVQLTPSQQIISVSCTSTRQEQLRLFKELFWRYGRIWTSKRRSDGNMTFAVLLNRSFDFLLPKVDSIPQWIFKNNEFFISFLAGYADAEGCIWSSSNRASFTLASYDKHILKQIYKKLIQLGIHCPRPKILVKKGHIKADGSTYHKDHWYLTTVKKSVVFALLEMLEFQLKHQKRLKDLKRAKQNILQRNQVRLERYLLKNSAV